MSSVQKSDTLKAIDNMVKTNAVVLYMKGTPVSPQCGFSLLATQILDACSAKYEAINVLDDDEVRSNIKQYSNWPTIPQLFIDGEFIGGVDIMKEMYEQGELIKLFK